jgi:hypothetical protein
MKRGLVALLAMMGFFIVSCSTTTDPVQSDNNTRDNGSVQSAENTHDVWGIDGFSWYNECTGKNITGDITIKTYITRKLMPDGRLLFRVTYNVYGPLYDEDGNKYNWKDNTIYFEQYADSDYACPWILQGTQNIRLLTPGGKNNMFMTYDYKYNIDCDWNLDVEYDNFAITCK